MIKRFQWNNFRIVFVWIHSALCYAGWCRTMSLYLTHSWWFWDSRSRTWESSTDFWSVPLYWSIFQHALILRKSILVFIFTLFQYNRFLNDSPIAGRSTPIQSTIEKKTTWLCLWFRWLFLYSSKSLWRRICLRRSVSCNLIAFRSFLNFWKDWSCDSREWFSRIVYSWLCDEWKDDEYL